MAYFKRLSNWLLRADTRYGRSDKPFGEVVRSAVLYRAEHLQDTNRAIRDLISQQGAMVSATESVRLQNRVDRMTSWVIALTVVTTVASIVAAYEPAKSMVKEFLAWKAGDAS